MGGGGFSMEPDNPLLDDFILSQACRARPRVCFIPTASGDAATYVVRFYRAFAARDCIATDLMLQGAGNMPRQPASSAELAAFVAEQDVLYVGGGNSRCGACTASTSRSAPRTKPASCCAGSARV
jgi:peptidase E